MIKNLRCFEMAFGVILFSFYFWKENKIKRKKLNYAQILHRSPYIQLSRNPSQYMITFIIWIDSGIL